MNCKNEVSTHGLYVDFGKYKGERWTRVPIRYLQHLVNIEHHFAELAEVELKRRKIKEYPKIEITGHAIDKASLRLLGYWERTKHDDEGIYSWLMRVSDEAINTLECGYEQMSGNVKINHLGMTFVFESESKFPVLKTVGVHYGGRS